MRIILASASPRRRELLSGLGLQFTVDAQTSFVESVQPGVDACRVPFDMAIGKSLGFHRELERDEVLITADTVVIIDSEVLGKPCDRPDAIRMLKRLSGRTHEVVTAVVIRSVSRRVEFSDVTKVTFAQLQDSDIEYYVDNYRPFDKAGSYGVQEWIGYVAVSSIEGSFYNVMGFPVQKVWQALKEFP